MFEWSILLLVTLCLHVFVSVVLQLLARDPALSKYQSTKTTVQRIQLFGDFLVILVAAGAVYEIAYKYSSEMQRKLKMQRKTWSLKLQ
jgi:succinate dehydrogenase/fumarate reductase cytochrome b subunit